MNNHQPIYAGRCIAHTEVMNIADRVGGASYAGVRVMQPSSGGGDEHYTPPSEVYLLLGAKDAHVLSAYFADIARRLQGPEA